MKLHASGEDYLEAVLVLQKNHGAVRSIDVARRVGVSKASVSYAVSAQTVLPHCLPGQLKTL